MLSGSRSEHYKQEAEHVLAVFETRLKDMAMAVPLMCCASDMLNVPSRKQVVVVGHRNVEFGSMLAAAHASYDINKTVIHIDPTNSAEIQFWEEINSNIALMAKKHVAADKVVAFVCQNFACSPPVVDPGSLEATLSLKSVSTA